MAQESNSGGGKGVGFTGLLQLSFIILKLLNKITWSWLWVLSPTWISIILFILIVIFIVKG